MFAHLIKLFKFGVSGVASLLTSVVVLYILTHYLHIWYIFSALLAFVPGFLVSFSLQKFWTFENDSRVLIHTQMVRYFAVIMFALLLNTLLLYVLVEHAHLHYVAAQVLSGIVIALTNFFLYQWFVFKK